VTARQRNKSFSLIFQKEHDSPSFPEADMKKICYAAGAIGLLAATEGARAVPSFALQTGQPCTTCHIGAFGPQLTAFGRAFKIGNYAQTGGQGWEANIPLSVLLLDSYTNTSHGQNPPPANHYGTNGNFTIDQASVFVGGHLGDYVGGLIQGTYDGVGRAFFLDNTDIRASYPLPFGDTDLRLGVDLNNGPTVQDPYNSSYAWGYPYVQSALANTPAAQPLLAGGLIGNSLGLTAYAWYDRSLYVEAGAYQTYSSRFLSFTGSSYGPGATAYASPYARVAYEWNWNGQSAHVGGIFLRSAINPATGAFSADRFNGADTYTDTALDAGYDYLGDDTYIGTVEGIFDHEYARLDASTALGASSQTNNILNQARISTNAYYQQTYGLGFAWQETWGTRNALLYPAAPIQGSANGRPSSNAFILEADYVPFGKDDSWAGPWVNLKVGVQYTIYTQFNGGGTNYDGFGRNASDNNTLYVFTWLLF
jgi:hypothetical protein